MTGTVLITIALLSLAWLTHELLRAYLHLRDQDTDERRRREQHDERVAQANGHPRTGNVDHIAPY